MAGFVQIIELRTSRIDEVRALGEQFRSERLAGNEPMAVTRGVFTADRDRPDTYFNIVEFTSYDDAMANSARPETTEFARRMAELCDEPPRFYNLDVMEAWTPIEAQQRRPEEGQVRA